MEERESELRRLKDESRLRAEGHSRAEGGERGGSCFTGCLGAPCFRHSDITKGFRRITPMMLHILPTPDDPPAAFSEEMIRISSHPLSLTHNELT